MFSSLIFGGDRHYWSTEEIKTQWQAGGGEIEMIALRILIVGANPHRATALLKRLNAWACDITFAHTCAETLPLLGRHPFDFVFSQFMLCDGSADKFLRPLQGRRTHMFFSHLLENDCMWLHVLDRGRNRWWKPTLFQPEELLTLLERHFRREFADGVHPDNPREFPSLRRYSWLTYE